VWSSHAYVVALLSLPRRPDCSRVVPIDFSHRIILLATREQQQVCLLFVFGNFARAAERTRLARCLSGVKSARSTDDPPALLSPSSWNLQIVELLNHVTTGNNSSKNVGKSYRHPEAAPVVCGRPGAGGEVLINRSTYQVETVLPIK
jgi:hypothetical protein